MWGNAYFIEYDGEVKLQESEVESIHMWDKETIEEKISQGEKITPDSIYCFREFEKRGFF